MSYPKKKSVLSIEHTMLGLLSFILMWLPNTSKSQLVSYLGIEQGMSNNTVTEIYKDKFGFMWFGTLDGLNRYDGYTFRVFKNKFNDQTSLPNNKISSMAEDSKGNLWIGTEKGIGVLNNKTMEFSRITYIPFKKTNNPKLYDEKVNEIKADKEGNLFICSEELGLLLYKKNRDVAIQIPLKKNGSLDTHYTATAITFDNKNVAWLMVEGVGLCFYDKNTQSLVVKASKIPRASCIKADRFGKLWIGTLNGLFTYNQAIGILEKTDLGDTELSNSIISDICFDNTMLWLATDGNGIGIVDMLDESKSHKLKEANGGALTSNAINVIYKDEQSRKWVGTLRGGINLIDYKKGQFKTIVHEPVNPNSLVHNFVFSFCEDENKNVWVGTDGGGISVWNRSTNIFTNYVHSGSNNQSLSNNQVSSIVKDKQQNIWVGTFGGGVCKFNKATGTFVKIPFGKVTNKPVWRLYTDREGEIWASVLSGQPGNEWSHLFKYNVKLNSFSRAPFPIRMDIISMTQDASGNLWLGGFKELVLADTQTGIKKRIDLKVAIRDLYIDKSGKLWIATEGRGLMRCDKTGSNFISFTEDDGLSNNTVLNIQEDRRGNIWVSTYNGLSKLNPSTKKFENFYTTDGLQSNQFYYNASCQLSSGEMLFGGIKGFSIFNPDNILQFKGFPPLLISSLRISNLPVNAESEFVENSENTYEVRKISLPYDKAVLSLDYVALEYSLPEKIQYAYFLKGWDKTWNYVNKLRTINYTRLDEGTYTLKIKSTNASGVWNPQEKIIYVTVLPPWYRTWWAYLIYMGLAGASIYAYLYYQKKQTRLQLEVKFSKDLNEKKIAFFTNISHELRAPLTLIANPIKELLHNNNKSADLIDLSSVYRNSRRLLSLVDQLLLFKTADDEIAELKPEWLNIVDVSREVFLCFNNQIKAKSLKYEFQAGNEQLYVFADREKIEVVLFNLLSNAVKFTAEGGEISLTVSDKDNVVEIVVKDSGRGIPEGTGEALFEKFYRLKDENDKEAPSGFGIGLYLTKRYIDLHKGSLTYTSKLQEGTAFQIILPKGDTHSVAVIRQEEKEYVNSPLLEELLVEPVETAPEEITSVTEDALTGTVVTKKDTLLLIDDDAELRRYLKQLLKDSFTIYEASSADRGIELIKESEPDMVVCDVVLQGMSGVEFCSKIKESPATNHIPVILLTGSSSPEVKLKGIECGADDYITKPFENDLLIARIKSILKGRNTLKQYFLNEVTLQNNSLKIPEEYSEFLSKCIAIIEKHMADEEFTLSTFTDEICMSRWKLSKKVKSISGLSISEFIRYIRLRKAAELMVQTDLRIKEVAFMVGIQDIKYFREQFSKLFGMNPSDFIRKYRNTYIKSHNLAGGFARSQNKNKGG